MIASEKGIRRKRMGSFTSHPFENYESNLRNISDYLILTI